MAIYLLTLLIPLSFVFLANEFIIGPQLDKYNKDVDEDIKNNTPVNDDVIKLPIPLSDAGDFDGDSLDENDSDEQEVGIAILAGTYPIDDGQLTINADGTFSGQRVEVNDYDGNAPPTTDITDITGSVSDRGLIQGSFSGTDTSVTIGVNSINYTIEEIEGEIEGQLFSDGSYAVSWTGPEPGTRYGQAPTLELADILFAVLWEPFRGIGKT